MSVKDELKKKYGGGAGVSSATSAAAAAATGRTGQTSTGPSPVRQDAAPKKDYSINKRSGSVRDAMKEKYGGDTSQASVERYRERIRRTAEAGLEKFRQDREARKRETVVPVGSGVTPFHNNPDIVAPAFDVLSKADRYRSDRSWMEPGDDWDEDHLLEFGRLYGSDPEQAGEYARQVNDYLNAMKRQGAENGIKSWSAEHPLLAAAGSILTAPAGLADFADSIAEYAGRGTITQKDDLSLSGWGRTAQAGAAEAINRKYGTLDENLSKLLGQDVHIPVLGDKGWGDAYSLGVSAAQSLVLGNAMGSTGTLLSYFGSAAASGVDEIKARGGTDEQALLYGALSGLFETAAEKLPLDNLLNADAVKYTLKGFLGNALKQAGMEGTEEALTSIANTIADRAIMGDKSNYALSVQELMRGGLTQEEAEKAAWKQTVEDVIFDFVGGMATGGVSMGVQQGPMVAVKNAKARKTYTADMDAELLQLALEAEEGSAPYNLAKKYQGKKLTGGRINELAGAYEQYTDAQEAEALSDDIGKRLAQLDAEDDVLSMAIAKSLTDQELTGREQKTLNQSAEGRRVLADMAQERELSDAPQMPDAGIPWKPGNSMLRHYEQSVRDPLTAEAKDPLLVKLEQAAAQEDSFAESEEIRLPEQFGNSERSAVENAADGAVVAENATTTADNATETVDNASNATDNATATMDNATGAENAQVDEVVASESESTTPARTIEEATEDFGRQAATVRTLYREGQDVEEFTQGIRAAWEMGNSGIGIDRAVGSARTQGITEHQRRQAYLLGQGAAKLAAQEQDTASAKLASGGTVRRKGVVKAQGGVTIGELAKTFNDPQKTAYKLLSFYAEATGVDVVLYRGTQEQETGRFAHGEDTIYVDIDAGTNGWDATDLGAYTMMRTFTHEFVHFVEKWNPEAYNELREAVFAEMEKNGQDAESLVELAMQEQGLSFDQASREVVAEALTDILPESQFVQTLANKHKTLFEKLKERLEEFVANLKGHWKKLTGNNSREAVALKKQVGEALSYAEEIVQLFDRVAGEAVEAYQTSVAGVEDLTAETKEASNEPAAEQGAAAPAEERKQDADALVSVTDERFTVSPTPGGGLIVGFKRKAPDKVRQVLKDRGFKWKPKGRHWEGKGDKNEVAEALWDAYKVDAAAEATTTDSEFLHFISRVVDGSTLPNERYEFGVVPQGMADEIKRITGTDVVDYRVAIEARQIEHILKDHGPNGTSDRTMADPQDIAKMWDVMTNPDSVRDGGTTRAYVTSKDGRNRPASTVLYEQIQGDGISSYVVQAVPETKKKTLFVVTAFRGNSGYKNGTLQSADALSPSATPGHESAGVPDSSVLDSGQNVNQKFSEQNPAEQMKGSTPSEKLANAILSEYLSKDKVIDSMALYALADKAFGGTQGEGAYNRKDAYDALELAVNKRLLTLAKDMNGDTLKAQQSVRKLEELLRTLPTQSVRTQEMQDFQQFSTPPNIAYLAAWAGNVRPGEMVLEPSAGIGGIAVFAKSWGAEVAVNELSKRRLGVLESMGFDHVFNENAEQLDNVLPDSIRPTLVLMNPPFSSTAGRTARNKTSNAERHIDQALARLADGGRLVAILGKGMNDADYRKYWDKVRKEYSVRANLSIDGSNYKKYGTTWGVQLVVIDKTGPQAGKTLTGSYKDLTEVPAVLEEIRNDRNAVERNGPQRGGDAGGVAAPDGRVGGVSAERGTGGRERSDGKPARNSRQRSGGGDAGGSRVRNRPGHGDLRQTAEAAGDGADGRAVRGSVGADHRADDASAVAGELARPEPQRTSGLTEEAAREDDGVYATFVLPQVPIPGGKKHPATLVESAAMSAVPMPKATYVPRLPANVVRDNLSDAQMVTVTYAGQAHEQMLPDGSRKGFFIGDGTGVGKGRQIAGIILDNFMQGRDKALWVSKNGDLYNDAVRDWTGTTGRSKDEVLNHSKTKLGKSIDAGSGILFTTYPMLRSGKNDVNRLDQIVSWLGEDFDGVIAFDEAHNMGNLYGRKSKMGKSKGSEMAKAGVELQRRLPKARIVYVSATAATEVDNLAYAERLGLWGKGTAFTNAQDFISKIGSSGLSAMELVIRDMKAMGVYTARSISYQGVAYDTIEHTLDENQTTIYNTMSSAWQTVMQNVHKALELTGGKNNSRARQLAMGQFYSSMQRFYNQALTSMSMPSVIADMRRELAAGRSCVLQIVNTNEAQQNKALAQAKADNLELDDLDLTPRESLIGYLETCFPVQEFEEYTDEDGNTKSRPVTNSKGEPVLSRTAIAMREALIAEVRSMAIPDGPMEMLFDAFGADMVAENTGRSRRVVPKRQSDGSFKRVEERRTLNSRTADVQAFQDGKKRILVFSDAGGTGKSYHADRSEKNQQQRIHYVLQPGWSASNAVQGFGRTHRSNEASAPIYKLVTTNIRGQKRFTSTIARRLDQLGALTKGQRDTGSGMFGAKDNLETDLARDSLREFYKRLGGNRIGGIDGMKTLDRLGLKEKFTDEYGSFKMDETTARDISTFLNRILALEVDEQNTVFDAFTAIYEMELEAAIQAGTLDTGMENVKADKIEVLDDKIIREDGNNGAATRYIQAKTYKKPRITTTVAEAENQRQGFVGIYETDNGSVRAVYRMADKTTEWGQVIKQYRLVGPNQGAKTTVWQESTLAKRAKLLDKGQWQSAWDKEVRQVPEYNEDTLHMLTGALLPIWDKLPQEGTTKVKRLIAADGRTYLGREIPATQIDLTLRQFQTGRTTEKPDAKTVMDRAIQRGEHFRLTRERAEIFRSRVSGEWRLEIRQMNPWQLKRYNGLIHERINFQDRYFIPKSEAGEKLLADLLEHNPIRDSYQEDQLQVRRIALTDRQVLELAAEKIDPAKFDKAGQDAFRIFNERLERLRTLQEDRREAGQLYKQQQFGPGGDRRAAAETLEKMRRLDENITQAADKVLEAEKGTALRAVLQEARRVVEQDQRSHDEAVLKEYRQKRSESAAQRKYRRAVQREVKELQSFILAPDTKRMKLCPEFLRKPVLELLETIDQSSKRKLSGGEATKADQRYANRLADLADILRRNTAEDLYEGFLDLPEDFTVKVEKLAAQARELADRAADQSAINTMTAAQLKELLDVLTGMKTLIRNANRFHSNAMFQHVTQAGADTVAFTRKHRDWSRARGRMAAGGNAENWIFWKNVRPALIFQRFGKVGQAILQELEQGQDALARNTDAVVKFAEKTYTAKEVAEWEDKRKTIRFADGSRCRLTVAQIMGLYCMAKREQAIDHLTHGGFVVQGEKGETVKVHMAVEDLGVFADALTRRQRAVADKLQKYMSQQGAQWGNAVTMRRFGIKVYGEEFYYPLATYDEKRTASIDKPEGSSLHALLNMSFTKELRPHAKNAVMAYSIFDVFADHMGSMAQYNAMALPVLDAVKWLNYAETSVDEQGFEDVTGVKTELRRVFGVPPARKGKGGNVKVSKGYAEQFILNLLKSYNSTSPQATPNDKLGLGMLHRYNRSQVAFNGSVAVKQPLAIFRAMQVISPGAIAKGVNPAELRQGMNEMLKYSGIAIWKDLGFYDVNVSKGMGKLIRHDSTPLDKITDAGMFVAEWADRLTWAAIWNACKHQTGGNIKKTTELFNKTIYETQVVDSVLTKTEYMRDQGGLARLFSSFRSEPTAAVSPVLNDVYLMQMEQQRRGGSFQTAWQKHGKHFMRSVAAYSVTGVITAAMGALVTAWRDDDDYQDFGEKWQEAMEGAIGDELNPFTKLPMLGDAVTGLDAVYQAVVKGEDPWASVANLPMADILQYAVDGGKILHDLVNGKETNYTWYGAIRKLLQAASGASGLPAATASREVVDLWNNVIGGMAPSLKVKTYEQKPATELKYAYLDGWITEEEATAELLKLEAAEDEDDAYWKIRAWEGGEGWSKYDALELAMANGEDIASVVDELTTHGIDEDDVYGKARSIVGEWLEDGAVTEEEARRMLVRYGDRDAEAAGKAVEKWKCEIETGIAFGDIKDAYLDGEITASRAAQMRQLYGGETAAEAEETVREWRAEKETGVACGDIADAFRKGKLTEAQAKQMYITYGGLSEEDAAQKTEVLAFVKENPGCEGISYAAVEDYRENCEGTGVKPSDYYKVWKFNSTAQADVDESGKSISGSKKRKVLEYIDSLLLTSEQKDALYFAFGYAESKLWDTPWH